MSEPDRYCVLSCGHDGECWFRVGTSKGRRELAEAQERITTLEGFLRNAERLEAQARIATLEGLLRDASAYIQFPGVGPITRREMLIKISDALAPAETKP